MAGQDQPAVDAWPDRGEDRGLVARRIRRAARCEPVALKIALDKIDERQVGGVADALEGDEAREQRLGLGEPPFAVMAPSRGEAASTTTETVDGGGAVATMAIACTRL